MSSAYGKTIRLKIFGQSHSAAVGMTLENVPAGETVDFDELHRFMSRRAPGKNAYSTARKEADLPVFLSGLGGNVTCGTPITAEENIEDYDDVPSYIKCDFTLVCRGDSMINARIFDGDIVCIKMQPVVSSGDIAAVMVGEDEATLKRVRIFEDHVVLEPENPMYKPLTFWGEDMNRVHIIGKATHFISTVK